MPQVICPSGAAAAPTTPPARIIRTSTAVAIPRILLMVERLPRVDIMSPVELDQSTIDGPAPSPRGTLRFGPITERAARERARGGRHDRVLVGPGLGRNKDRWARERSNHPPLPGRAPL